MFTVDSQIIRYYCSSLLSPKKKDMKVGIFQLQWEKWQTSFLWYAVLHSIKEERNILHTKNEEGYVDRSHLAQEMASNVQY